jgi:hypothetical protein
MWQSLLQGGAPAESCAARFDFLRPHANKRCNALLQVDVKVSVFQKLQSLEAG